MRSRQGRARLRAGSPGSLSEQSQEAGDVRPLRLAIVRGSVVRRWICWIRDITPSGLPVLSVDSSAMWADSSEAMVSRDVGEGGDLGVVLTELVAEHAGREFQLVHW